MTMRYADLKITRLPASEDIPFYLLLLADETIAAIEKYIHDSEIYVAKANECPNTIGIFVLQRINEEEIEIKNIAVAETCQGKGIGSYMIDEIKRIASAANYRYIIVGTPDSSLRQINFYQRNGFTKFDLRKNFFIENYPEPIIEDGIVLRDMMVLRMNL